MLSLSELPLLAAIELERKRLGEACKEKPIASFVDFVLEEIAWYENKITKPRGGMFPLEATGSPVLHGASVLIEKPPHFSHVLGTTFEYYSGELIEELHEAAFGLACEVDTALRTAPAVWPTDLASRLATFARGMTEGEERLWARAKSSLSVA